MCKLDKNMSETEGYDAIGLNVALEFSKKSQEEIPASSKEKESHPTPHGAMTTDTTATGISTAQEGPPYGIMPTTKMTTQFLQ